MLEKSFGLFFFLKKPKNEKGNARYIYLRLTVDGISKDVATSDELQQLAEKKLSRKRLHVARDLFLFSCYTGLSYADTAKLTRADIVKGEDGGIWIQTHRVKNNNRVRVPLLSPALRLINYYKDYPRILDEDFILPKMSNQKVNAYLKEITKALGWSKYLTFHCARHTFATTVTLTNGVPIETVGQMLVTRISVLRKFMRGLRIPKSATICGSSRSYIKASHFIWLMTLDKNLKYLSGPVIIYYQTLN